MLRVTRCKLATSTVGFVYLVRLAEFVKIGRSRNPTGRLSFLQGLPWEPTLLHQIASNHFDLIEKALHQRFREVRFRCEWFRLTEEDIALIKTVERADTVEDLPPELLPPPALPTKRHIKRPFRVTIRGDLAICFRKYLEDHPELNKNQLMEQLLIEALIKRDRWPPPPPPG